MKFKKIFIYLAIACCNGTGDVLLKRGMDNLGEIHLNHWTHIFNAFIDPWVILGILFLAGFFYSYLTALSWADLTFVLPATAFGYVVTAFLSRVFLHETVSPWRWAGVLLITCGVGLVARGPSLTERHSKDTTLGKESALGHDAAIGKQPAPGKDTLAAKDAAISRAKEQHEPA